MWNGWALTMQSGPNRLLRKKRNYAWTRQLSWKASVLAIKHSKTTSSLGLKASFVGDSWGIWFNKSPHHSRIQWLSAKLKGPQPQDFAGFFMPLASTKPHGQLRNLTVTLSIIPPSLALIRDFSDDNSPSNPMDKGLRHMTIYPSDQ